MITIFKKILTRFRCNGKKEDVNKVRIAQNHISEDVIVNGEFVLGTDCYIEKTEITGIITLGNSVKITRGAILHGNIKIGDYTTLSGPSIDLFSLCDKIIIGKYCSIARHVSIQEGNHKYKGISANFAHKFFTESPDPVSAYLSIGDIVIGNDVWIGAHAVIINNVKIGDGAIVGANSLVNKDVAPYSIVGGVPAKIIGYRFEPEIVDLLLKLKWWDLDHATLKKYLHLFTGEISYAQINDFYQKIIGKNI